MVWKNIAYLHSCQGPKCPHCGADLSEMGDYLYAEDFKDCSVNQDNEGYCRDWKEKKHKLYTCWECQRLLAVGCDADTLYIVACRSETDLRYLELVGEYHPSTLREKLAGSFGEKA